MMNKKHTMNDTDAQDLISFIRQRAIGGADGTMDHFCNWPAVSDLVESTLVGVGYDPDWVYGTFSDKLKKAVDTHSKQLRTD